MLLSRSNLLARCCLQYLSNTSFSCRNLNSTIHLSNTTSISCSVIYNNSTELQRGRRDHLYLLLSVYGPNLLHYIRRTILITPKLYRKATAVNTTYLTDFYIYQIQRRDQLYLLLSSHDPLLSTLQQLLLNATYSTDLFILR